jgi:hypothetical protein
MNYKLISSKTIIGEMYSDFNITNDDWVNKASRYMSRALALMKIDGYYEIAYHIEDVQEFNAPLPCDDKYILAVLFSSGGQVTRLNLTNSLALGMDFTKIATHNIHQGRINANYLRTNFENGTILYIYYRIPKDEDGHLLIPDNADVLEALPFYLIYRMSLSGYKHPVISMEKAEAKWDKLFPRARNSMNFPTIEEMHRMSLMLNNPLYINNIDEEWNTGGSCSVTDIVTYITSLKEKQGTIFDKFITD